MEENISVSPTLRLDLNNFDSSAAEGSRYVLTSPRSLESCAILGVKPVELLYKSLSEFADENLDTPRETVTVLYETYEKERRKRVRLCREEREKIIHEGKGEHSSFKKQSILETVLEQAPESQSSEARPQNTKSGDSPQVERRKAGPSKSEVSNRSSTTDFKGHQYQDPVRKTTRTCEPTLPGILGDLGYSLAKAERKLERLMQEVKRETGTAVPDKDRKIAALMLAKHEEEQWRLRQSLREVQLWDEEQGQERLRRARAERGRQKEREFNAQRWRESLELRRRLQEQEAARRTGLRTQEAVQQEDRRRCLAEEQEAQRRERTEAARREAVERKHYQEMLLRKAEQEEQDMRVRESQLARGKELRACRRRESWEKGARRRVQLKNQQQWLRHLLLKREVEEQALAQELLRRSAFEQRLQRSGKNRGQLEEARLQGLKERSARENAQGRLVRDKAGWQERQHERHQQIWAQQGQRRMERAAQLVEARRGEKAQRARQANAEREHVHHLLLEKVRQEEEILRRQQLDSIAHTERRREQLLQKREAALEEARRVARASFHMRERVREETQSRTFDQMALEAQITASLGRIKL